MGFFDVQGKERKKEEEIRVQTWFKQKLVEKSSCSWDLEGICCRLN